MATFYLAPDPLQSTFFIPGGNVPANGGQLFFYQNGTTTKQTVYKDSGGAASWTNPIVLDSGGNLPSGGEVWFPAGQTFTVVFAPATDTDPPVSPYWTKNALTGMNDTSALSGLEWVTGPTPTFVGSSVLRVAGDQTATLTVGRRIQATITGPPTTAYGTISSVVFASGSTNVGISTTGPVPLDAGLSALNYGALNAVNPSVPALRSNSLRFADGTDPSKTVSFDLSGITSSTNAVIPLNTTVAAASNLIFLSSKTPTPNATSAIIFTSADFSWTAYDEYVFELYNLQTTSGATALNAIVSLNGGSTYFQQTGNYQNQMRWLYSNGSSATESSATVAMVLTGTEGHFPGFNPITGKLRYITPASSTYTKLMAIDSMSRCASNVSSYSYGYGYSVLITSTNPINAIKFFFTGGAATPFSDGTIKVWGLKP